MELEAEFASFRMGFRVACEGFVTCGAGVEFSVLDDDTVVDDCYFSGSVELAIRVDGRDERDVVAVPFSLGGCDVYEGWALAIEGTGLTIRVGFVCVALQDLDLVILHEENAAVSSFLAVDLALGGKAPFEKDLNCPKLFLAYEITMVGDHGVAYDFPLRLATIFPVHPGVEVGAIKQDGGIGRRFDADGTGGFDDGWLRAGAVVNVVGGSRDDGGVLVAFDFFSVCEGC